MSEKPLHEHLNELHQEIANTQPETGESQDHLDSLTQSIEKILESPGEVSFDHHRLLMGKLSDAIVHFEVSHPRLTDIINNVIQSLNALGI